MRKIAQSGASAPQALFLLYATTKPANAGANKVTVVHGVNRAHESALMGQKLGGFLGGRRVAGLMDD